MQIICELVTDISWHIALLFNICEFHGLQFIEDFFTSVFVFQLFF